MSKFSFKQATPYIAALLIFILITLIYFNPLIQGKKLRQDDIMRHKGMSKEIVDYREKTGEEALWTNSMFGGMPAYQISVKYKANLFTYIDDVLMLGLPRPAGYVFLYFLGFFILLLVLRVNPWLSIAGAIAFAFSSYFFIILEAGHNSKAHAIGYMAPVLAGIILAYRGKYLWGAILTGLFLALEIQAGHPQITYYLLIVVVILGIFQLIDAVKQKALPHFLKATAFLLLTAILAVLTHTTNLWGTYEYGKHTIRGKSELTADQENKTSGLDKDYATDWSYGIQETLSLMIPNAKGGATDVLANNEKAMENVNPQYRQAFQRANQYWGNQPFTSGPVYVGAIIVFLFVLGLFVVKGRLKWVLFIATVLSILLSWGKNFMPLTDFFLDYVPGYNKFRAVSMTLVIAELTIPILAILALDKILRKPEILRQNKNALYISFGLTAGISLLLYLFPTVFLDFFSRAEADQFAQFRGQGNAAQINAYIDELESARMSIFKADAIRSFLFILVAAALIWFYSFNKLNKNLLIGLIAILFLIDLAVVANRYLDSNDFVRKSKMEKPYQASIADQEIIKDTDPNFRVFNLAVSSFNDASTSYFHKSIGGYHGAKLRRYQELITYAIIPERQKLMEAFQRESPMLAVDATLPKLSVLNMLNTKYFILDPAQPPLQNRYALGNAWFVNSIRMVENADEEISAVQNFKPSHTAIVDQRFSKEMAGVNLNDSTQYGSIRLTNYKPNKLTYQSKAKEDAFAVFSEIYYPEGWNAYIDGEKVPHVRVNYVLRGLPVPAGEHQIVFAFEPAVYRSGEAISLIASIILILLIAGGLYFEYRKGEKPLV